MGGDDGAGGDGETGGESKLCLAAASKIHQGVKLELKLVDFYSSIHPSIHPSGNHSVLARTYPMYYIYK